MPSAARLNAAVVLAGGLGTRLGSLTADCPKPLVLVNGRPYLEHQLLLLKRHGVTQILLLTGYLGERIESYFGSGAQLGLSLSYSCEPEPRGTGGALYMARDLLLPEFFLVYGDSYLDIDYQSAYEVFHQRKASGPCALMVVSLPGPESDAKGNVMLDPGQTRVTSYAKGRGGDHLWVDAGVLVLNAAVASLLPDRDTSSLEEEIYPRLASEGRLLALPSEARFYDIGTPDRLAAFERKLN